MRYLRDIKFVIIVTLLLISNINAKIPHIGYIYPAGGQQGTKCNIKIGGQFLDRINEVYITGDGIQAEIIKYTESPQKTRNKMKRELNALTALKEGQTNSKFLTKAKMDKYKSLTIQQINERIKKMKKERRELSKMLRNPKRQPNTQIEETISLEFTISKNAVLGKREIRLMSKFGASNPMAFYIDQLPEINENKPVNIPVQRNKSARNKGKKTNMVKKLLPTELSVLPVIANGQIMPGEIDRFYFNAIKGQQLVFAVKARALIPYLADAVPGWIQAVLTLYDEQGNEVAYVDDYRTDPDPVLFFDVLKDGKYSLEIRDSIYRGREDFVYRITIGELPFITDIFPLGGQVNEKTSVQLYGKNLSANNINILPKEVQEINLKSINNKINSINTIKFAVNTEPEKNEKEPNNDNNNAQELKIPIIINGRIQETSDQDIFSFIGSAGQQISAEVFARRLNSPLDSVLKLINSNGKVLSVSDDNVDKSAGLITHHADSSICFKLPSDDKYFIHLSDIQDKGGRPYAYRLHIKEEQPDFDIRIAPSGINIPMGGTTSIIVHALRKGNFKGDIQLSFKNMADKLIMSSTLIPADKDKIRLTITALNTLKIGTYKVQMEGSAIIQDKKVFHDAVPVEDMMQAFLWRHLVPAEEMLIKVTSPSRISVVADIPVGEPLKISISDQTKLVMKYKKWHKSNKLIKFVLDDVMNGIRIEDNIFSPENNNATLILKADADELEPGIKGNLIVTAQFGRDNNKKISMIPAIPFEIVD